MLSVHMCEWSVWPLLHKNSNVVCCFLLHINYCSELDNTAWTIMLSNTACNTKGLAGPTLCAERSNAHTKVWPIYNTLVQYVRSLILADLLILHDITYNSSQIASQNDIEFPPSKSRKNGNPSSLEKNECLLSSTLLPSCRLSYWNDLLSRPWRQKSGGEICRPR